MTKVLIKSRKIGYRSWTVCLALLTVLALSSCTKKSDNTTANKSGSGSATQSSTSTTSTTSTTASKDTTTKASSKKSKTLSPQAQKLGVKPTGSNCPGNAPIKGNINNKGESIYHEAKSSGYKAVKAEICFKDVATAQKAGFRAPKGANKKS